jgi:hypothetical protein
MADLYFYPSKVKGHQHRNGKVAKTFAGYIAYLPGVQKALRAHAFAAKAKGDVILTEHRLTGHSRLTVRKGTYLDWWLILDDSRGQNAAAAIEYGRTPWIDAETGETNAGSRPLWVLHRAMGLPPKEGPRQPKIRNARGGG